MIKYITLSLLCNSTVSYKLSAPLITSAGCSNKKDQFKNCKIFEMAQQF